MIDFPPLAEDDVSLVADGLAGVALLIGEPDLVGQGLGPRVLSQTTRARCR